MAEWKEILTEIISDNPNTLEQVRLTVSELGDMQYLHLRKYYMDFEGQYLPTKVGIAIPITIETIANLFNALTRMLAKSDVLHIILDHADEEVLNNVCGKTTPSNSSE